MFDDLTGSMHGHTHYRGQLVAIQLTAPQLAAMLLLRHAKVVRNNGLTHKCFTHDSRHE